MSAMQFRSIRELEREGAILAIQDGNHGGKHPKASDYVEDGIPFVMASDITDDGLLDLQNCKKIPKSLADKLRIGFSQTGDVLFTHKGSVGRVSLTPAVDSYIMLTPQVTYYRLNENMIDRRYFIQALRSPQFQARLSSLSAQSTRPYISITTQRELMLPWKPLPIQRSIGDILSTYDDLIENNTRRITILEEISRRMFEEWFVHASDATNWPIVPFTELASVGSGGTPRKENSDFWGGSIPFFTPRDAWQSVFAIDTLARITDAGLAKCNSKLYPTMTVFITARGTVGNVLLAPQPMAMNQSCYALQGIGGVPQSYVFFATVDMADELRAKSTGAVFDAIIVDTFRLHRVPKPPRELMLAFDRQCAPMLEAMLNLRRVNTNLRITLDLLLPKLISGEIEVRVAEEALETAAA